MKVRQKYSKAFKLEALRRLQQGDKSVTELAFELGLQRKQLYLWQQQLQKTGPDAFASNPGVKNTAIVTSLRVCVRSLRTSR